MDKQNVSFAGNGIFSNEKEKTTDTSCDIDEPQNTAKTERKKPDTKG